MRIRFDIDLDEELETIQQAPRKGRYHPRQRVSRPRGRSDQTEVIAELVEIDHEGGETIDPWVNPDAAEILQRDITRLADYFARYGIVSDPIALANDLWQRYGPPWIEPVPEEGASEPGTVEPTEK